MLKKIADPKKIDYRSPLDIFGPGGPWEPRCLMFSNQKKCLIDFQIGGAKRSALSPKKLGCGDRKWHFWLNISFPGPFDDPTKKANEVSKWCSDNWIQKVSIPA